MTRTCPECRSKLIDGGDIGPEHKVRCSRYADDQLCDDHCDLPMDHEGDCGDPERPGPTAEIIGGDPAFAVAFAAKMTALGIPTTCRQ